MRSYMMLLLLCLALTPIIKSQEHSRVSLNEKLPDMILGRSMDNPTVDIKLSDLKGKLVILDFWSINCSSCIGKFPLMDSLQKVFKEKIKIITVTYNSEKEVNKLFARIKIKKPELPMIVGDTILKKMFPHNTVPHHVWIDGNGIVKYITENKNANHKNILAVLSGKKMSFRYKNEFVDFDRTASLLEERSGRLIYHKRYYSLIMKRIEEFGGSMGGMKIDSASKNISMRYVNFKIENLFNYAFSNLFSHEYLTIQHNSRIPKSRVIIETKPRLDSDSFSLQSLYCYESLMPYTISSRAYTIMQEDLQRFFPYHAFIEKRKVKCWVLINKKNTPSQDFTLPINKLRSQILPKNKIELVSLFSIFLADRFIKEPVIDGTELSTSPTNVVLNYTDDFTAFREQLHKYGFDLQLIEKEINMLIIKDRLEF